MITFFDGLSLQNASNESPKSVSSAWTNFFDIQFAQLTKPVIQASKKFLSKKLPPSHSFTSAEHGLLPGPYTPCAFVWFPLSEKSIFEVSNYWFHFDAELFQRRPVYGSHLRKVLELG